MEEMNTITPAQETNKLSYEELESVAVELRKQCMQMYDKLNELNMENVFKRLDYLFKVVKYANMFNEEFATACISEIETIMTIKSEEPATEE